MASARGSPISRFLIKAGGILLLWLLSVTSSAAAHAPRQLRAHLRATSTQSHALPAKKLNHQTTGVGSPLVRVRKVSSALSMRRARLQHTHRIHRADDDDAIQNDAPAASFDVDPCLTLQANGAFVSVLEQQPFTHTASPRSPRGPPSAA